MKTFNIIKTVAIGGLAGFSVLATHKVYKSQVSAKVLEQVPVTGALQDHDGLKLINVQIFFRHGARTPIRKFDGMKDVSYDKRFHDRFVPHTDLPHTVINIDTGGPQPRSRVNEKQLDLVFKGGMTSGQLSTIGRDQTYLLGKRLRQRYIKELGFIDDLHNYTDVFVRSTNVKRCVESLRCVISGMFGIQQFEQNGALVIPVKHIYHEYLYPNLRFCDTLRHIEALSFTILADLPEYKKTMVKVQKHIGADPSAFCDLIGVRDQLVAAKTHGIDVPQWLADMEEEVKHAAVVALKILITGDPKHQDMVTPLACGRQYEMIENTMKASIADEHSTARFHLYSCHDTSVFPLLAALGYPFTDWPPYAADLRYELYQGADQQHYVKILYCGQDYTPPDCDGPLIPFTKFQEIIKPFVISIERYKLACDDISVAKEFARLATSRKTDFVAAEAPTMM